MKQEKNLGGGLMVILKIEVVLIGDRDLGFYEIRKVFGGWGGGWGGGEGGWMVILKIEVILIEDSNIGLILNKKINLRINNDKNKDVKQKKKK